jgi:hypothetical protein
LINTASVRTLPAASLLLIAACSSQASGSLSLVTGEETDTFDRAPMPTTLEVDDVDSAGMAHKLATATLPTRRVDLGSLDANAVGSIRVTGLDASGNAVVLGQSLLMQFGAADGASLPVFVQRTGEFARLAALPDARPAPLLVVVEGRYLFVSGGTDPKFATATTLYDFAELGPLGAAPSLPSAPESAAFIGTVGLLISGATAIAYDFSTGASNGVSAPSPPQNASFAGVAGGATVTASDGSQYIVGATRTAGDATNQVLAIDPSGNLSWLTLSAPRLGAAATWVDGRGLVVAGGNVTGAGGTADAGVEVIASGTTLGAALAYSSDASAGAAAVALDTRTVLIAGGLLPDQASAGVRTVDLACAAQCAPAAWTDLPMPLTSVQAFTVDASTAIVVGSELTASTTHVFRVTSGAVTELPTKVAHQNARAVSPSPIGAPGSILLYGGAADLESFER